MELLWRQGARVLDVGWEETLRAGREGIRGGLQSMVQVTPSGEARRGLLRRKVLMPMLLVLVAVAILSRIRHPGRGTLASNGSRYAGVMRIGRISHHKMNSLLIGTSELRRT